MRNAASTIGCRVRRLLFAAALAGMALPSMESTAKTGSVRRLPGGMKRLLAQLSQSEGQDQLARLVAKSFFAALVRGDVDAMRAVCLDRVSFDGHWIEGEPELRQALAALSERAQLRALRLKRLLIVSREEMIRLYGPPPARLADAVDKRDQMVLARFNRQGAVAVLTKRDRHHWRIKALTD